MITYLRRRRDLRREQDDWRILIALRIKGPWFAYDLTQALELRPARVFLSLRRLQEQGLIEDGWEDAAVKRHPRRWYRLTSEGQYETTAHVLRNS